MEEASTNWKRIYVQHINSETKWRDLNVHHEFTIRGKLPLSKPALTIYSDKGTLCMDLIGSTTLITGTEDKKIKIWDLTKDLTNEHDEAEGNGSGVRSSSSKVFKASPVTLRGHSGMSYDEYLPNRSGSVLSISTLPETDVFVSGSSDKTIRVWYAARSSFSDVCRDIKSKQNIATFQGHQAPVTSVIFRGSQIFSCSADKTVKMWDIEAYVCQ